MRTPPQPVEPWSQIVRLEAGTRTAHAFELVPDAEARSALAEHLGILGLRKLRFAGGLTPEGKRDWRLDAELGATLVQSCVVTAKPVSTRIDEPVERRYVAEILDLPASEEIEMPDETVEPLPATLDLGAVMAESLVLALPPWPRADGADAGEQVFAERGTRPMTDKDIRPFAGLKDLLDGKDEDR